MSERVNDEAEWDCLAHCSDTAAEVAERELRATARGWVSDALSSQRRSPGTESGATMGALSESVKLRQTSAKADAE